MSQVFSLTSEIERKELPLKEQEKSDFMEIILSTLKKEEDLTLKEKLDFSFLLSISRGNFTEETIKEFCEEECHLALLNWVWKYAKKLKKFKLETEIKEKCINITNIFDDFFPKYNKLLIEINFILDLLINILTSIDYVLNKWKSQIDKENEQKIMAKYMLNNLGTKRKRNSDIEIEDRETEIDSIEEDNLNNNINNNIDINNKKIFNLKNKKNKVSFDLNKNSVIYYHKNDIPFQITLDKINNSSSINK